MGVIGWLFGNTWMMKAVAETLIVYVWSRAVEEQIQNVCFQYTFLDLPSSGHFFAYTPNKIQRHTRPLSRQTRTLTQRLQITTQQYDILK